MAEKPRVPQKKGLCVLIKIIDKWNGFHFAMKWISLTCDSANFCLILLSDKKSKRKSPVGGGEEEERGPVITQDSKTDTQTSNVIINRNTTNWEFITCTNQQSYSMSMISYNHYCL